MFFVVSSAAFFLISCFCSSRIFVVARPEKSIKSMPKPEMAVFFVIGRVGGCWSILLLYHKGSFLLVGGRCYNCFVSAEFVSLYPPEQLGDRRFFDADLVISYLTVRLTPDGEETLVRKGEVRGPLWTPRGWLGLMLRIDPSEEFVTIESFPEDGEEIQGYVVSVAEWLGEMLRTQQIVGADQAQGVTLRQVRILPSSKAEEI